jgi:hypothetical protein
MSTGRGDVGTVMAAALVALPVAAVVAIVLLPLWSWIEAVTGIESVGHSGPAGWCYLTTYLAIFACVALVRRLVRRRPGG